MAAKPLLAEALEKHLKDVEERFGSAPTGFDIQVFDEVPQMPPFIRIRVYVSSYSLDVGYVSRRLGYADSTQALEADAAEFLGARGLEQRWERHTFGSCKRI